MAADGESYPTATAAEEHKPVRHMTWPDRAQLIIAGTTVVALIVTIVVAWQGQQTVRHNSQITQRQSLDTQLSTAITSIGSSDTAEEVAGLLLLTQNTSSRLSLRGETGEPTTDVYSDYTTALQILSGYLSSRGQEFLSGYSDQASAPFGRGYGIPASPGIPLDIIYAANQIRVLLASKVKTEVAGLGLREQPALDLANDELNGQSWYKIDFSWISAFLVGIDLRGADLASSQWSASSDLSHAYLQCTDLRGANFAGANLSFADLAGADVQGADFSGANLEGTLLAPVFGVATWSRQPTGLTALPAAQWDPSACLRNKHLWRNAPAPGAAPSPSPTGSASPKPSVTESPKPTVTPT